MNIRNFFFLLLAHHSRDNLSHTIRISLGKRKIYLCARCTGIYTALIISLLLFAFVFNIESLPVWGSCLLAYTFGLPVILSWSKQTITDRDNSNRTRISTGIGGGIGLALLFFLPTPLRELSLFGIFGAIFLVLYFGKIRRYKKSYSTFKENKSAML